jgi:hypothetical protein
MPVLNLQSKRMTLHGSNLLVNSAIHQIKKRIEEIICLINVRMYLVAREGQITLQSEALLVLK